jgi:PAS domain S-box-containing protein
VEHQDPPGPVGFGTTLTCLVRAAIRPALNPALPRGPFLLRYGIAAPLVALAALVQWGLLEARTPFILLLPTTMAVAWYGGLGPGLLATACGLLVAAFFFFEPRFSFRVDNAREVVALTVFGALGAAISVLCEWLQRSERARRQAEERTLWDTKGSLRDREDRLQAILDAAVDAIITIDRRGIIQAVNPAAERMFGYTVTELIGQNVNLLMPSPYREEHDDYLARYLRTREKHIIGIRREVEARRKDGSVFPVELAVSEVEHLGLFTGIHHDLTQRRQLERDVVEAASREQRRIGQDLHDTVAQELAALNLLAGVLTETLRTDPAQAAQLVERMGQGLQRSQRELRTVLRGLLPVTVDSEGLMTALADLALLSNQQGKVSCTFNCPTPIPVADNVTATQLYLIAQEAVHNALQHGRPRNVRISLRSNHLLVLRVQDDGTGMPARPTTPQGLGLRIMRNRAAILGARLTIEPAEPTGTVVTCALVPPRYATQEILENG